MKNKFIKNKFIVMLLASAILASCVSSKKYLAKGNYDAAINKGVEKILKSAKNRDEIVIVDKAYRIANEEDHNRISFLQQEGRPDSWIEITDLYNKLIARQKKAKMVTPLIYKGVTYQYEYVDYNQHLIEAKRKAAEFLYHSGIKHIKNGGKQNLRKAHDNFIKTKVLAGNDYDVDNLINECRIKGTTNVLVQVTNNTHLKLSGEFMDNILMFNSNNINSFWVKYHTKRLNNEINYDYIVNVNLNKIFVSPDQVNTEDSFEERKVEDGWKYVYDKNGNVMKDSLGNDIKIKKYKTLKCSLIKTEQLKSSFIDGVIEYISQNPEKMIKQVPISTRLTFSHFSARAVGNIDALSEQSKKMCKSKSIPFPSNEEMVYRCTGNLKNEIRRAIFVNKSAIF